jgi:hypothetical protein
MLGAEAIKATLAPFLSILSFHEPRATGCFSGKSEETTIQGQLRDTSESVGRMSKGNDWFLSFLSLFSAKIEGQDEVSLKTFDSIITAAILKGFDLKVFLLHKNC